MDVISYVLSKKYTDEKCKEMDNIFQDYKNQSMLKTIGIEKELNDFKNTLHQVNVNQEAKQSTSGYGIISLPKNAANGQVSVGVVKGLTATNLIKNGNFTTDVSSWTLRLCTLTSVDGVAEMTDQTSTEGQNRAHQDHGVPTGHKIYARADVKATTNLAGIGIPTAIRLASHSGNGEWEKLSFIRTVATGTAIALIDNRTSDWDTVYFDNVFAVDLTAIFGAGNEPTVEECDQIFANWFDGTKSTLCAFRIRTKDDADNVISEAYVIAKDPETNEILQLRSLPNGTKDEISLSERKLIKRVSNEHIITLDDFDYSSTPETWNMDIWYIKALPNQNTSLTENLGFGKFHINGMREILHSERFSATPTETEFIYYVATNGNLVIGYPKTLTLEEARNIIIGTKLTYQLAEPIITPIQVSGNLITYPSGTIYIEPVVADAGIYGANGIGVLHQELPINYIEKISKIDFETGLETELDTSQAIISEDGTYFTHPELVEGDIVFFEYYYPSDMTTQGETEVEYYDSRYVIQDSVTGKFYKWTIAVADGVPSIQLQEV